MQNCCHHWYSGVDWNICGTVYRLCWSVTTDTVVWIEIFFRQVSAFFHMRSPLIQWCGLKLALLATWASSQPCHHWYSGVDWNTLLLLCLKSPYCHHWYSGVDWNWSAWGLCGWWQVTTDTVVWIEMVCWGGRSCFLLSPLIQWCGLKYIGDCS